jgi:nitrous oxidase accessory protein NosD
MQVPSAVGILMPQYSTSTIVGNVFNGTSAGGQVGVQLGTKFGSNGVIITGNNFFNLSVAVNLLVTSSATNVQSNSYAGNLTNVNNLGTGNTVGGGSS